jgi:hypothetical protein
MPDILNEVDNLEWIWSGGYSSEMLANIKNGPYCTECGKPARDEDHNYMDPARWKDGWMIDPPTCLHYYRTDFHGGA